MLKTWEDRIVAVGIVKEKIMELDKDELWTYFLPELAAKEEEIESIERKLGYTLDEQYRTFLKYANGWKAFYQTVDLFGTIELASIAAKKYTDALLNTIDDAVISGTGFTRKDFLTIAATKEDIDLFVLTSPSSHKPGTVIWFADEVIDVYDNFIEYFLAMIDYNREETKHLMS